MTRGGEPAPGWVDLWQLDLDLPLGSSSSLSDEEQERARRFHRPEDASRWTAARSALRQILGSYLDLEPSALRFVLVAKDKPTLELPAGEELHFNLSHSRGLGLLAVSRSLELGVDIEYSSSELDHLAIAERVFPPELSASLAALSGEQRSAAFYRTWVRAEAAAKCSGTGLVESGQHSMRDLRLVDIDVPEGYAGALALRERVRRWDPSRLRRLDFDSLSSSQSAERQVGRLHR